MRLQICAVAALGICLLARTAEAVTIAVVPVSAVSTAPFALANFGNADTNGLVSTAPVALSNGVLSFGQTAGSTPGGIYDGNVGGVSASPVVSGNYLAIEPGNTATFSLTKPQSIFQLLWGSLDSYNSLTFSLAGTDIATVTGAQVIASGGLSQQNDYVTITGLGAFDKIVATSSAPAFEFVPNVQVSEPGTLVLVGTGLAGLAWWRRRSA